MVRTTVPPGCDADPAASGYNCRMDRASAFRASSKWLSDRAAALNTASLAETLLAGVDTAATSRWEAAVRRADALPGQIRPEKVRVLTQQFSRELGAVGAATGVAAAAPTVGTAATIVASTAELAWFTGRSGDFVLTMAALHGRRTPTVEERRAWVLAVLIFGGSAREGFTSAAKQMGVDLEVPGGRVPLATLRAINGVLSSSLVRKYGARRGVIAVGTAIPLGIGAVIGGSANYAAVNALSKHADRFFSKLPYSAIEVRATEVPNR
jgi:hypothetical protein